MSSFSAPSYRETSKIPFRIVSDTLYPATHRHSLEACTAVSRKLLPLINTQNRRFGDKEQHRLTDHFVIRHGFPTAAYGVLSCVNPGKFRAT
jgi:hypothetical protein